MNGHIMTPEEFRIEMVCALNEHPYDPECFHLEADDIICKLLKQLGYEDGVQIFEDAHKWYA